MKRVTLAQLPNNLQRGTSVDVWRVSKWDPASQIQSCTNPKNWRCTRKLYFVSKAVKSASFIGMRKKKLLFLEKLLGENYDIQQGSA
jgi:hypothetical protein